VSRAQAADEIVATLWPKLIAPADELRRALHAAFCEQQR
jgi:uncharacterized protein YeaO (DUF488 family)